MFSEMFGSMCFSSRPQPQAEDVGLLPVKGAGNFFPESEQPGGALSPVGMGQQEALQSRGAAGHDVLHIPQDCSSSWEHLEEFCGCWMGSGSQPRAVAESKEGLGTDTAESWDSPAPGEGRDCSGPASKNIQKCTFLPWALVGDTEIQTPSLRWGQTLPLQGLLENQELQQCAGLGMPAEKFSWDLSRASGDLEAALSPTVTAAHSHREGRLMHGGFVTSNAGEGEKGAGIRKLFTTSLPLH